MEQLLRNYISFLFRYLRAQSNYPLTFRDIIELPFARASATAGKLLVTPPASGLESTTAEASRVSTDSLIAFVRVKEFPRAAALEHSDRHTLGDVHLGKHNGGRGGSGPNSLCYSPGRLLDSGAHQACRSNRLFFLILPQCEQDNLDKHTLHNKQKSFWDFDKIHTFVHLRAPLVLRELLCSRF